MGENNSSESDIRASLGKKRRLERPEAEWKGSTVSAPEVSSQVGGYEEEIIIEERRSPPVQPGFVGTYEEREIIIEQRPSHYEQSYNPAPAARSSPRRQPSFSGQHHLAEAASVFDRIKQRASLQSNLIALISLLCLAGVLVIGLAYSPLIYKTQPLPYEIENGPNNFMEAGKNNNAAALANMLTSDRQNVDYQQRIAYLLQQRNLFENYRSSEVNKESARYYIKDGLTCCDVNATLYYSNANPSHSFTATFVNEYGNWKLRDFSIR